MSTNKELLRFNNLTLGYDCHPAVHHLDYTIDSGALIAVVGPNGSGKSTLLKGIVGDLIPLEGEIIFNAIKPSEIAYLPQQANIDKRFPISVFDMVAMGLWNQTGAFNKFSTDHNAQVYDALDKVGLSGFESRPINTLSGGQMQRTLFARQLLQDAPLILLDEPFKAIDVSTINDLLKLIKNWNKSGKTIVSVLHDIDQVKQHFPQTLLLSRELIAAGKTQVALTAENLEKANNLTESFNDEAAICAK